MLPAMQISGFLLSHAAAVLLSAALAAGVQAAPPVVGSSGNFGNTSSSGDGRDARDARESRESRDAFHSGGDDLDRFLNDKGLLSKIEQAGQRVGHKASELVVTALGFLGVPYRMGGNTVESGFDCSGFVRAMYQQTVGLILPRKAEQQAAATQKIERGDLQPGDLVFFNTLKRAFSHVGIYVGEGKFIHSPRPGGEVRVENMGVSYWNHRFDGARRVSGQGVGGPGVGTPVVAAKGTAVLQQIQTIQQPAHNQPISPAPATLLVDPLQRFSTN